MAKVINQFKFTDQDGVVDVLLYCDDDEGYGVEIRENDCTLSDYAFGNNSVECYNMAHCWFQTLIVTADESDAEFTEFNGILYPSIILPEDKRISDEDLDIVHNIISDIYDTLGGHPLNDVVLDDVRSYYDSDTPAPLWVSQVLNIE